MSDETRTIPATACRCVVGPFELGDNGEGAKSAPFRMVARSGDAIDHWWWGRVVHDLDGMRLPSRNRVAIDYVHDENQIVGYANKFDTSTGNLEASGSLTPYDDDDRASEIVHKAKQGVPYEASINFGGDGIKIEEYEAGDQIEVNGRKFSGPITVVREWPLRGIAVCPYGADSNTSTEFSNSLEVSIMTHETIQPEAVEETPQSVDTVTDLDTTTEAQLAVDVVTEELVADAPPEKTGQDFLDAFGDKGGVWFAQGKSFEEAQFLYTQELEKRVEELSQKLAARPPSGETVPIDFDDGEQKRQGLAGRIVIK